MKIQLSLLFTFLWISVYAKDIVVSFEPADNQLQIDSVVIQNLTTLQKIKIAGNESVGLTNEVSGMDANELNSGNSIIYPNPTKGSINLFFLYRLSGEC